MVPLKPRRARDWFRSVPSNERLSAGCLGLCVERGRRRAELAVTVKGSKEAPLAVLIPAVSVTGIWAAGKNPLSDCIFPSFTKSPVITAWDEQKQGTYGIYRPDLHWHLLSFVVLLGKTDPRHLLVVNENKFQLWHLTHLLTDLLRDPELRGAVCIWGTKRQRDLTWGFSAPVPLVGVLQFSSPSWVRLTSISFLTRSLLAAKISAFSVNGVLVYI